MPFDFEQLSGLLLAGIALLSAVFAALWLAMIFWTYRDMRSRSHDPFGQILATLVVTILGLPGLLIYLILRPPETLSEQYERSLEEEALLQELESKNVCPGCGHHVKDEWRVCPYCHTKLKKPCTHCQELLDLPWTLCPYCSESQIAGVTHAQQADNSPAAVTDSEFGITYDAD